jgi:HK97 family phage prohead protease
MRLTKRFRLKQIDEAKGQVTAVIATLNVKDHDGDVILPGAFDTQEAQIVPVHDWDSVPLGRASISETNNEVVAKMRFNLDIEDARKWHSAIKFDYEAGNPLQEYSFGYEIKQAEKGDFKGERVQFLKKLKVIEVSPVMLGAGIGTGTVDVKKNKKAWAEVSGSWEAIQRALRVAASIELNDPYCYIEATLDDSVIVVSYNMWTGGEWRESYFQFDWTMSEGGGVTLSNRREVQLDLVVSLKGLDYMEHLESAVNAIEQLKRRSKARLLQRKNDGRTVSKSDQERLATLHTNFGALLSEIAPAEASGDVEIKAMSAFADVSTKIASLQRS